MPHLPSVSRPIEVEQYGYLQGLAVVCFARMVMQTVEG
jgi:hypothetical protein